MVVAEQLKVVEEAGVVRNERRRERVKRSVGMVGVEREKEKAISFGLWVLLGEGFNGEGWGLNGGEEDDEEEKEK